MSRTFLTAQTRKWYLADHPKPAALADAKDPFVLLKQQAVHHEHNRLEAVSEMLGMVAIMTARGVLTGNEVITVGKAIFQYAPGDRANQIVAAHCLPGHAYFAGQAIHTTDEWKPDILAQCKLKPLPLAAKLRGVAGRTDFVDQAVNHSDSLIEIMEGGRGIKPSLGHALYQLQQRLKYRNAREWVTVGESVAQAVRNYRLHASYACEERLEYLQKSAAHDSAAKQKLHIVETYLEIVRNPLITPEVARPHGFQQLVSEVVAADAGGGSTAPI